MTPIQKAENHIAHFRKICIHQKDVSKLPWFSSETKKFSFYLFYVILKACSGAQCFVS